MISVSESAAAPAAPSGLTPELIPHNWAANGECQNPDTVHCQLSKNRRATFYLGAMPDGSWRSGFVAELKSGDELSRCTAKGTAYTSRRDALHGACVAVGVALNRAKDKAAAKALETWAEEIDGSFAGIATAGLPANAEPAAAALPPLPEGEIRKISVVACQPSPENARKVFDPVAEEKLAESIRAHGLLQPIAVRRLLADELGEMAEFDAPGAQPEQYEIILGERRWRAHRRLGAETIRAIIYEGVTRAQAKAAALVENLHREDLNPIEEAEGYRDLMEAEGLTATQCADRVNRSRPVVSNALRVLELPASVVDLIRGGKLTMGHGTALARFKAWPKVVEVLADEAVSGGLATSVFEKGLPCTGALVNAGVAVGCNAHEVDAEWPEGIDKHPAYFRQNEWLYYTLDAEHWRAHVAKVEAARKEAVAAEEEKRKKAAAQLAKNPAKVKSLEDLDPKSFAHIEDQTALNLIPAEATASVAASPCTKEKVTVCTKPDLARVVDDLIAEAKTQDRKPKWPKLFGQAMEKVRKTKKLGTRELTLLLYLAGAQGGMAQPSFTAAACKLAGVKLPGKALDNDVEGQPVFVLPALGAMADAGPLDFWKVIVTDWLKFFEDEAVSEGYNYTPEGDAGELLRWILEQDTLGFLEESKSGLKEIQKRVEGCGEYQAALAEATGAAKTSTKGKK
jgi:ParB/RepB/Spo0J family partition protein